MLSLKLAFLPLIALAAAWPQAPDPAVTFEVASIKVSPPMDTTGGMRVAFRVGCNGGPGTSSPGQYVCSNATLGNLINQAFNLKSYQFNQNAAGDIRYDITAKIPAGSTKEQVRMMLQNLLAERFKLAYHYDKKDSQVFELGIARNGPKMKESPPPDPAPADGAQAAAVPPPPPGPIKLQPGPDGMPILPTRRGGTNMMMMNGRMRMQSNDMTMEALTNFISNQLGKPVTDVTGLQSKYDITLTFAPDNSPGMTMGMPGGGGTQMMVMATTAGGPPPPPPPPGAAAGPIPPGGDTDPAPPLMMAVQQDLGLKLEQKKGTINLFVIDHVEKTPTEN